MLERRPPVVVVTGDATIDWHLAKTPCVQKAGQQSSLNGEIRASAEPGGAMLLARLLESVSRISSRAGGASFSVRTIAGPGVPFHPGDHRFHHSYATFRTFPRDGGARQQDRVAWRVDEFLGLDRRPTSASVEDECHRVVEDTADAAVVVLDDADLGYRDQEALWPRAVKDPDSSPWVLLKMAGYPARGDLWNELYRGRAERLVVVLTIADLRQAGVQVSRELSWERTAHELVRELTHNPEVNALSRCAYVVVSFGPSGAFLMARVSPRGRPAETFPQCTLLFDPELIEGMWEQEHRGGVIGYTVTLTAAIARQLARSAARPDMRQGVQSGLAAMRTLHLEGFRDADASDCRPRLAFPTTAVAAAITAERGHAVAVPVPDPSEPPGVPGQAERGAPGPRYWTILSDSYADKLDVLAERIVIEGPETALRNVPLGRFGDLLTVDRAQIESLRSIRRLVAEYCEHLEKIPLSLAIFGAPGSGKTYGLLQMAETVAPDLIERIDFNLSQFSSPCDLVDALHQVRDVVLKGKVPLVLWDEFDTALAGQRLGWLRYFLSPMEDGKFQEGQIVHPIGRSIFVFVGGTCSSMREFMRQRGSDGKEKMTEADFVSVKGPDFVSRLRGQLEVHGPDPDVGARGEAANTDPYFVIRRAILLRSILASRAGNLLQGAQVLRIDPGVLYAFLHTGEYRHGIRSMSSIVSMSRLSHVASFERSCLPDESQLDLHVDGREFLAMVHGTHLTRDTLERLAEAAHEVFCDSLRRRGFAPGPRNDERRRRSSSLRSFHQLPDDEKEQNRCNVRDIPVKLARVGRLMAPARSDDDEVTFTADEIEALARDEHDRWMRDKVAAGWRVGRRTDKASQVHEALVPWEQLPESQKQKDRDLVAGIPRILAAAGYTVVPARSQAVRR